jgi:hypothetical protein
MTHAPPRVRRRAPRPGARPGAPARRAGLVKAERVIGGNLDQDDPDAIRILDPQLDQAPGLRCWLPDDRHSGCGQPGVLGGNIPYLEPDSRTPGRAGRVPADFEQFLAEEEHHSGIVRRAELPVGGQAQYVTVEAVAAVQVAGPQQDPAAQNVHVTISASCLVTTEVRRTRAVPPNLKPIFGCLRRDRAVCAGAADRCLWRAPGGGFPVAWSRPR